MSAYARDLIERVGTTFIEAFLGVLVLSGVDADPWHVLTDKSVLAKAGLAGVVAVVALVKTLLAKWVGSSNSASLDPANPGPVMPAPR